MSNSKKHIISQKPIDWLSVCLGDNEYFDLATGGTPSTAEAKYWGGKIPWLSSGEVHKKRIFYTDNYISELGYKHSNACYHPVGSTLIALAGQGKTRGTSAITEIELTTNQSVAAVIPNKEKVDSYYVYHYLDNEYKELRSESSGAGRAGLSLKVLSNHQILLPILNEQRKIAKILTTVDNLIEKTETLIAKYQSIKQGMMHDLFTRGVDANGQLRPSVDEAPELYKESELGWIPKGWEVLRIEDLATQVTDGDHHTPIRSNSGEFLLSARNILNGEIILKDVDYVPFSEYQRMIKRCFPQPGDILISCSGTIGRICEVPYNLKFGLVRSVALIKLNKDKYLSRYAEWTLRSEIIQRQILNSQLQAAQPNLFQEPIKKLLVPLPKKQEQEFIYNKLDLLERCIKTETINTKKMINLKHGLMQDLLTGKVRVTPDKPKDTKS